MNGKQYDGVLKALSRWRWNLPLCASSDRCFPHGVW